MYENILNDGNTKITEKQKEYLKGLKDRTDREKEMFSHIQKSADGVLPTYRDALRQGEIEKAGGKTPYQVKEESLQKLQKKFAQIDKKGHSNSKEYTEMIKSAQKLQVVMKAVHDPEKWKTLGFKSEPSKGEIDVLLKKTEDAARKAVDTYIKEKGSPFTQFGKNRLAAAKELKAELEQSIKSKSSFSSKESNKVNETEKKNPDICKNFSTLEKNNAENIKSEMPEITEEGPEMR